MSHKVKYKYLEDGQDFSKKSLFVLHKRDVEQIYWRWYFEICFTMFVLSKQTSYCPEWKTQFWTVNLVFYVIILLKFDYMIFIFMYVF